MITRLTAAAARGLARPAIALLTLALAGTVGLAACAGRAGASPGAPASIVIPTMPPDDLASGAGFCIDEATMDVIDQLRAPDADVEGLLQSNKPALIAALSALQSNDSNTREWRDKLVAALQS